jgi:hypothetical protein
LTVACICSLFVAAPARAVTVTVGSPLTGPFFSTLTCGNSNGCTYANTSVPEPGASTTSPISGTVVRWRMAGNYGGTFKLRVLRPAGGGQYTGAGSSEPIQATGTTERAFAANLPIQAGDLIGIDYGDGHHLATATVSGSEYVEWGPALGDGSMGAPFALIANREVLFNADVQPPPGIAATLPNAGSISGGLRVGISGHDFTGVTAVRFGTTPAVSFTVESEGSISAVAPASTTPGVVDVSVTTAAGTTAAVAGDQFTYVACVVPTLKGKRLKAARKSLKKADCILGKVKGRRSKTAKVRRQSAGPGTTLPPGSAVNVRVR